MPETIVAVYDTPAHAALAVADLEMAGIPPGVITQHTAGEDDPLPPGHSLDDGQQRGFWARLFGTEPHPDATVFHRSMANGATVITVLADPAYATQTVAILESHAPADLDARAQGLDLPGPQGSPTAINQGTARVRRFVTSV